MTQTVLITGVAGLLGARLADWITTNQPDVTVIGVDNLSGGYRENVNPKVKFYHMDVDNTMLKVLFTEHRPDIVYHFAAYAAEGLSPFIRRHNYLNNVVATANLVNQCITYDVRRLVFTSSMAVYGHNPTPFREDMPLLPADPYGIAKAACEQDIRIAGEQHGLDWCILRPHNVYGIKQNIWDAYRNVLGIWMFNILHDQPISIYGDGLQTRAFTDIDDITAPMWLAGSSPAASKQVINLGGIHETTILEAAHVMETVTGTSQGIVHLPKRFEVKHAFSTWQKSVDLLGFAHKTTLAAGLTKMWTWAQQQPRRNRFVWSRYEIDKGLYPYWQQSTLHAKQPVPLEASGVYDEEDE